MDKIQIAMSVEDNAQEQFIKGILKRILKEYGFNDDDYEITPLCNKGGKSLLALKTFINEGKRISFRTKDILIVGSDANCMGFMERKKQIDKIIADSQYKNVIMAIPNPHIERWYLMDLQALKKAVDAPISVNLPSFKCEKGFYKRLLKSAFQSAGIVPPLGGTEYGEEIAKYVDLYECGKIDHGFKEFNEQLRLGLSEFRKQRDLASKDMTV